MAQKLTRAAACWAWGERTKVASGDHESSSCVRYYNSHHGTSHLIAAHHWLHDGASTGAVERPILRSHAGVRIPDQLRLRRHKRA